MGHLIRRITAEGKNNLFAFYTLHRNYCFGYVNKTRTIIFLYLGHRCVYRMNLWQWTEVGKMLIFTSFEPHFRTKILIRKIFVMKKCFHSKKRTFYWKKIEKGKLNSSCHGQESKTCLWLEKIFTSVQKEWVKKKW